MTRGWSAIVPACLLALAATAASARTPRIQSGADAWVITSDIPPFTLRSGASFATGRGGELSQYLGDHPDDAIAGVDYADAARGMRVEVRITRNGRTDFLDHLVEAPFRDDTTGRMSAKNTMVSLFGHPAFLYCDPTPNCEERLYSWRSGPNVVVTIEPKAFSSELARIACPEPTEILQAYLQRYPSALTLFAENDAHAASWRRDQTALELAAAESHLDRAATAPPQEQYALAAAGRAHLETFAELRAAAFRGPDAEREAKRLHAPERLPPSAQLVELNKIRQEYRQWWNAHQNDPVRLP